MKSNIWITWYKVFIYISVAIILILGFAFAIDEAYDLGELLMYVIPFFLAAGLDLVVGMLIATFFENVQVIRDKVEELSANNSNK